jgi:hypothetical protein
VVLTLPRPNETRQGRSMYRNAVQYASTAPRYQGSGRGRNDLRTAMNFVLVNHRALRRPSCCAACSRPLQRSYLRDLSTRSGYCSVECYPGPAAGGMVRSLAKADPFGLVAPFLVLPMFTIDVVSAVFDSTWRSVDRT